MKYLIQWQHRVYGFKYETIREFNTLKEAIYEKDRLQRGVFGETGTLRIKEVFDYE